MGVVNIVASCGGGEEGVQLPGGKYLSLVVVRVKVHSLLLGEFNQILIRQSWTTIIKMKVLFRSVKIITGYPTKCECSIVV